MYTHGHCVVGSENGGCVARRHAAHLALRLHARRVESERDRARERGSERERTQVRAETQYDGQSSIRTTRPHTSCRDRPSVAAADRRTPGSYRTAAGTGAGWAVFAADGLRYLHLLNMASSSAPICSSSMLPCIRGSSLACIRRAAMPPTHARTVHTEARPRHQRTHCPRRAGGQRRAALRTGSLATQPFGTSMACARRQRDTETERDGRRVSSGCCRRQKHRSAGKPVEIDYQPPSLPAGVGRLAAGGWLVAGWRLGGGPCPRRGRG